MKLSSYLMEKFVTSVTLFGTFIFYVLLLFLVGRTDMVFFVSSIVIMFVLEVVCASIKLVYTKKRPHPEPNDGSLLQKYEAGSFPSIHSARAMALAIILGTFVTDPTFRYVSIFVVIAVGYSRIYLKKHDMIDVLGGFGIGALISIIGVLI